MDAWNTNEKLWTEVEPEQESACSSNKVFKVLPNSLSCSFAEPVTSFLWKNNNKAESTFSLLDRSMFKCSRDDQTEVEPEADDEEMRLEATERKRREIEEEVRKLVELELESKNIEENNRRMLEHEERHQEIMEAARRAEELKEEAVRNAVENAIIECEHKAAEQAALEASIKAAENYYDISPSKKAMRRYNSKNASPIQQYSVDVRIDALDELRAILNRTLENDGLESSDLLLKAAILTMKAIPSANAKWMEDHIRTFKKIDVNISVQGEDFSIFTPTIPDAASKGLRELAQSVRTAEQSASDGTLDEDDCDPGTFAVQNLGKLGIKSFSPILPDDQACLLAIGSPEQRAIPNDDKKSNVPYTMATMVTATLVCDDKMVDAITGSKWLNVYKNHIENPTTLLL